MRRANPIEIFNKSSRLNKIHSHFKNDLIFGQEYSRCRRLLHDYPGSDGTEQCHFEKFIGGSFPILRRVVHTPNALLPLVPSLSQIFLAPFLKQYFTMADEDDIAALVVDNGSGMCKGKLDIKHAHAVIGDM